MKVDIPTRRKEFDEVEKTIAPGEYHTIIMEKKEEKKNFS